MSRREFTDEQGIRHEVVQIDGNQYCHLIYHFDTSLAVYKVVIMNSATQRYVIYPSTSKTIDDKIIQYFMRYILSDDVLFGGDSCD